MVCLIYFCLIFVQFVGMLIYKVYNIIVSSPLKLGGSHFWNLDKEGSHENIAQKWGVGKRGGFQIVSSVFLKKSMFSLLLEYLSLLDKYSLPVINRSILLCGLCFSRKWCYEIYFPLTLNFKQNSVNILLLMFISISISWKKFKYSWK